jgi:hypothetical protein
MLAFAKGQRLAGRSQHRQRMNDTPAPTDMEARWRPWAAKARAWGPPGNERRLEGPPRLLLRLLAPILVASTLTLFVSGVALIIVGHGGGPLLQLHAVSFAVWGVLIAVHILAYLSRVLRVGLADWRRDAAPGVAGNRSRRVALLGALLAGVILALATYSAQDAWLDHRHHHGHADGAAQAPPSGRRS